MAANNIQLNFTELEIKLVKFLFKHYKERFNPRQLAKTLNLNHSHINKLCKLLEKKTLLKSEDIGNAIYYTFSYEHKLAIKFIEYIISIEEFPKQLIILKHNLSKFEPLLEFGCVFGSSIENIEFNDIDVLLVYKKENMAEINKIKDEIRKSGIVEKPIRYLELTFKDILVKKYDKIVYNILSNNLVFSNPEKFVEAIRKCHI